MKICVLTFFIVLSISSCVSAQNSNRIDMQDVTDMNAVVHDDYEEAIKLIQQVVNWSQSQEAIDLYPVLVDEQDSFYVGFDMVQHNENLDKLKKTTFFSVEFIENYNQIILTLDRKIRNKEFKWLVGDMPLFRFVNGLNPWCLCQGFSPSQFENVEIIKMEKKTGELIWHWEKDSDWVDFKFSISKENNKWQISYMQGFDYEESIKRM